MARACSFSLLRDWWLSRVGWVASSAELRSVDLASGKTDSVLPGVTQSRITIFRATTRKWPSRQRTAAENRRFGWRPSTGAQPPRQIARAGDQVSFGADGHLVFRSLEEKTNLLVRIKKDGTGRERITTAPILDKYGVSPDGEWVIVLSPGAGVDVGNARRAHPTAAPPRKICDANLPGRMVFRREDLLCVAGPAVAATSLGKTQVLAIPVPAGKSLPDLPASGISRAAGEGADYQARA